MDWIEQIFGISPDGGTGATEFLVLFAVLIVPLSIWWVVRVRRTQARERSAKR
jgi:hypothetical protein